MDEHQGMGGSYVRDPKTGKRTLVERTGETKPKVSAEVTETTKTPAKPGKEGI